MLEVIKKFIKAYYPIIFIFAVPIQLFLPYLSGKYILTGGLERYNIFEYVLNTDMGWVNFFKMNGEFIGGFMGYGNFNPVYYMIKWSNFLSSFQAEHLLMLIYFIGAFWGTYYFFQKNQFNKYISIFCASVYVFNSLSFEDEHRSAMGSIMIIFLPLLLLQAQSGFKSWASKIIFVSILFFESIDAIHFQHVVMQITFIFFYLLFLNRESLKTFFILLAVSTIGMIPQTFLTFITLKFSPSFSTGSLSGNTLIEVMQAFHPFLYFSNSTNIDPHFYTSILASLTFIFCLSWVFTKKNLPNKYKFFFYATIILFIMSINNNPIVILLNKIPLINIFLSRNYYRYSLYYTFALSCTVAYLMQYISNDKDEIVKYFKKFFYLGLAAIIGFLGTSLTFLLFGAKIWNYLLNWYTQNQLPNVKGGYPHEYYFSLLKKIYNFYITNFSLLSVDGMIMALPFISFLVCGSFVFIKKYRERLINIFPVFLLSNIIFTALIFGLIFGQSKIPQENYQKFKIDPNSFVNVVKTDANWRNGYVLTYGDYSGANYISQAYADTPEINLWLMQNFYLQNYMMYNSAPGFVVERFPFKPLRQSLIGGYIGYMSYQRNESILNDNIGDEGRLIDQENYANNLATRIDFLRNMGVRYVVSHYDFSSVKGLKKIAENKYNKGSDFIPDYKAKLFLYELERYGGIISVPAKVQTVKFDSIDINNLDQVKGIFDKINKQDVSTIELKGDGSINVNLISQTSSENMLGNIVFDKDKINFITDFKNQNFVLINMTYYPGWRAYVDKQEIPVGRANINSMSVLVPEGKHNIELKFDVKEMILGTL